MQRPIRFPTRRLLPLGCVVLGLLAGCYPKNHCIVDNCATIAPGALPLPNGTYTNQLQNNQAAKAEADDFVVYKHEWRLGGVKLGPDGDYHVNAIAKRLPEVPFPVVLEPHPDGKVNEARRQEIINLLTIGGVTDAEMRVMIGYPEGEGLYGEEAERIYLDMLTPPRNRSQYGSVFGRNSFSGGSGMYNRFSIGRNRPSGY